MQKRGMTARSAQAGVERMKGLAYSAQEKFHVWKPESMMWLTMPSLLPRTRSPATKAALGLLTAGDVLHGSAEDYTGGHPKAPVTGEALLRISLLRPPDYVATMQLRLASLLNRSPQQNRFLISMTGVDLDRIGQVARLRGRLWAFRAFGAPHHACGAPRHRRYEGAWATHRASRTGPGRER